MRRRLPRNLGNIVVEWTLNRRKHASIAVSKERLFRPGHSKRSTGATHEIFTRLSIERPGTLLSNLSRGPRRARRRVERPIYTREKGAAYGKTSRRRDVVRFSFSPFNLFTIPLSCSGIQTEIKAESLLCARSALTTLETIVLTDKAITALLANQSMNAS